MLEKRPLLTSWGFPIPYWEGAKDETEAGTSSNPNFVNINRTNDLIIAILNMLCARSSGRKCRSVAERGIEFVAPTSRAISVDPICCLQILHNPIDAVKASHLTKAQLSPPGSSLPFRTVWTDPPKGKEGSPSFYDLTVEEYALKPMTHLTMRHFLDTGRDANVQQTKLLESAAFMCNELPIRLARRLLDLQLLPFIVVTNPHIKRVYEAHWHAFNTLRNHPIPRNSLENEEFTALLRRLVDEHAPMLDLLAMGMREIRRKPLIGSRLALDGFLESMLRSRISRRVLAEQHINLTNRRPGYVGVINLHADLAESVDFARVRCRQVCLEHYGIAPEVVISGNVHLRVPYIEAHLDYMLYELLKNSMRAVVERHVMRPISTNTLGQRSGGSHRNRDDDNDDHDNTNHVSDGGGGSDDGNDAYSAALLYPPESALPPIHVRICEGTGDTVTLRISDQGGGILPEHVDKIWEFGWTDLVERYHQGDFNEEGNPVNLVTSDSHDRPVEGKMMLFPSDISMMTLHENRSIFSSIRRRLKMCMVVPENICISVYFGVFMMVFWLCFTRLLALFCDARSRSG